MFSDIYINKKINKLIYQKMTKNNQALYYNINIGEVIYGYIYRCIIFSEFHS